MKNSEAYRILVVDDNPAIHEDFKKIFQEQPGSSELEMVEARLFQDTVEANNAIPVQIESALQGQEALMLVQKRAQEKQPYSLAFVDVRMPPGWDGIETIKHIWNADPDIQIVLCTAYSDYSWKEILSHLRRKDQLMILKKPFDIIEVQQMVFSLGEKWFLARQVGEQLDTMQQLVRARTIALEEAVSTLKATLEATEEGIVVLDRSGAIQTHNKKFLDMWNVPAALVESMDKAQILAHFVRQIEGQDIYQKIVQAGEATPSTVEVLRLREDKVFECCCQPQVLDGKLIGRVWSFRDITRRMAMEQEVRQTQKMECVGHLAGGVAHDFNNILTVIQGHAALLQDMVDGPGADCVEEIVNASEKAAGLTRQLLAFSRRNVLRLDDLDLHKLVSNFTRMLARLIGENIQLKIINEADCSSIRADAGMVEQVLMNLAVNARDAMASGGTVLIRLSNILLEANASNEKCPLGGDYVCMEVSDSGTGIAPEIMTKIFEPFFTTKELGKGTGLGLPTVYGIVKQHGGWIDVQSKLGHGTMFKIYFPLINRSTVSGAPPFHPSVTKLNSEAMCQ